MEKLLYQEWYSTARWEAKIDVLGHMMDQNDDYAVQQLSYMDAPELLPAGYMYDTETGYEDWDFGPCPMPIHVWR